MTIRYAIAADAANITDGGKVNILGIFDVVIIPEVPSKFLTMTFCVGIDWDSLDAGKTYEMTAQWQDPEGRNIAPPVKLGPITPKEPFRLPSSHVVILPIPFLDIVAFGPHSMVFKNGGEVLAKVSIEVVPFLEGTNARA